MTKLSEATGWSPEYNFETLMDDMIVSDENYYKAIDFEVHTPYDTVR